VGRARDALRAGAEHVFRDRTRSAKRLAQCISSTPATRQGKQERPDLYAQLLRIARASVRQAEQVRQRLASSTDRRAPSILGALEQFVPLIHQVCAQTERRIFHGEVVPAADKVASLFEPHTAIIRRGKVRHPAEFGRKLLLDEVDGGLVSRYVLLPGNPPDAEQLPASVAHHQAQFGQPPSMLTADRSFCTLDNERHAQRAGVRTIALPRSGTLSPERRCFERRPAFRRAYRFRAGVEGRISVLKRRFGLARCRYHGEAGMERWVGLGLLAHNLRQISRCVAARHAA
jgi:IS5 family transposase